MTRKEGPTRPRPRVFLSYGRKDASALAAKLKWALINRDFVVWQDTSELRAGLSWEEQIVKGLQDTDVVIALLSPHSTRRFGPDSEDSVCLDELALARYGQPSKPIVPILAVRGATVPLTVLRLHYLDFTEAPMSDPLFERKLDELVEALDAAALGNIKYRSWDAWLRSSLDFERLLYAKHRGFVGRRWLLDEIENWRTGSEEAGLLILGDPGIGKSSIIAELTLGRFADNTLATYCCQADVSETLRPANFVRTIASQLASRLSIYSDLIEAPDARTILERAERDPASAFDLGVLTPLARVPHRDRAQMLCIDGLDEAISFKEGSTIVDLLASSIDRLPTWLKLLATSRENRIVSRSLGGLRRMVIDAGGRNNIEDLTLYVSNQMDSLGERLPTGANTSKATIEEFLVRRAEGNFLYADLHLRGLLHGETQLEQLGLMPPGLDGAYERYLRRAFPTSVAADKIRPVLELLCAADGPIPRSLLAQAAELQDRELVALLSPLAPFLTRAEKTNAQAEISFWHRSFYDFLTALENSDSDFGVDPSKGDRRFASLFVHRVVAEHGRMAFPPYLRRRGLDHLALCGQFFEGLSDTDVNAAVGCAADLDAWPAIGGIVPFAPAFVSRAVASERWDAIEKLVDAFHENVRRRYFGAGLLKEDKEGGEGAVITGEATNGHELFRALGITGLAIYVVDQVLAVRGVDSAFSALVKKLGFMRYMAGGCDVACWGSKLSRMFEDYGSAQYQMICNLESGRRAETWEHS